MRDLGIRLVRLSREEVHNHRAAALKARWPDDWNVTCTDGFHVWVTSALESDLITPELLRVAFGSLPKRLHARYIFALPNGHIYRPDLLGKKWLWEYSRVLRVPLNWQPVRHSRDPGQPPPQDSLDALYDTTAMSESRDEFPIEDVQKARELMGLGNTVHRNFIPWFRLFHLPGFGMVAPAELFLQEQPIMEPGYGDSPSTARLYLEVNA